MSDAWRERVEEERLKRKWSRARLAREAKCSAPGVTELLNDRTIKNSKLVPLISQALGIPLQGAPTEADLDPVMAELWDLAQGLTPDGKRALIEIARQMRPGKKST